MSRLKLVLEYDGTEFVGWQVQPNGRSVQATVESALEKLLGQRTPVLAAGRIELLWYLREQSISWDYHRYGNLGERANERRKGPPMSDAESQRLATRRLVP